METLWCNKIKKKIKKNKKNYHPLRIPKLNIKIVERGKLDTSTANTQMHDHSLSLLGIGT